jgi:hypothetical protein
MAMAVVHVVDVIVVLDRLVATAFRVIMIMFAVVLMVELGDLARLEGLRILEHASRHLRHGRLPPLSRRIPSSSAGRDGNRDPYTRRDQSSSDGSMPNRIIAGWSVAIPALQTGEMDVYRLFVDADAVEHTVDEAMWFAECIPSVPA